MTSGVDFVYKTDTLCANISIKKVSAVFLFVACAGTDIFFIKGVELQGTFFIYFTFACLIFFIFLKKGCTLRLSYGVIPLIAFEGIYFLSLFWTIRLKHAEIVIVSFLTGFLMYLIFLNMLEDEDDIYLFLKVIVIGTSINALLGIFQAMLGVKIFTLYGFAAHGAMYNPNVFSGFLGIVYPLAILTFIKTQKKIWLLPVFLIFLSNIFSISRVGIFTMLLISAIVLLFLFKKGYRHYGINIFLIILLTVVTYFFSVYLRARIYTDISSEISLQRVPIPGASINRTIIWQGTLPIISNHFFLGAGLRSFEDMFQHFNNPFVVWPRPHAHNLFLHIASEVGIVGLSCFIFFVFVVLSTYIRNYKNAEGFQSKILTLSLFISILGFFFNNLVEYNWEYPLFQILFYFIASSALSIERSLNPQRKGISIQLTKFFRVSFAALLIAFWVFYVGTPSVGQYYLFMYKHFLEKGDERALDSLIKASLFDPSDHGPYLLLSQTYKEAWLNTKRESFLYGAIEAQRKAAQLLPMNADLALDLAKLFEEAKRMDEAKLYYEKAVSINPYTPQYKEELASFLARNQETDKAIFLWEDLKTFLEKYEPTGMDLMTVYMNLCAAYKKVGNLELLKNYLDLVMGFPDGIIKKEPGDSTLRKNFISYKKKAADELTNLIKSKRP